ncbi:MAG: hypothetical protein AAGG08_06910, partial [Actinomycetota bacterium]
MIVPGRSFELSIERCFIPLELRGGTPLSLDELASGSGATVVMGDPGSGKSALLSMVVKRHCEAAIESPRDSRLPIFGRLTQIVGYLKFQLGADADPHRLASEAYWHTFIDWFNSEWVSRLQ